MTSSGFVHDVIIGPLVTTLHKGWACLDARHQGRTMYEKVKKMTRQNTQILPHVTYQWWIQGVPPGHTPPQGSRFFRFHIQNFRNVAALGVGAPPRGWRPPYGKSWIRRCIYICMHRYSKFLSLGYWANVKGLLNIPIRKPTVGIYCIVAHDWHTTSQLHTNRFWNSVNNRTSLCQ